MFLRLSCSCFLDVSCSNILIKFILKNHNSHSKKAPHEGKTRNMVLSGDYFSEKDIKTECHKNTTLKYYV